MIKEEKVILADLLSECIGYMKGKGQDQWLVPDTLTNRQILQAAWDLNPDEYEPYLASHDDLEEGEILDHDPLLVSTNWLLLKYFKHKLEEE